MFPLLLVVVLLFLIVLWDWFKNRRYWGLLKQVPGPKPWFLFGNVSELGLFSKASQHINPISIFLQARLGLAVIFKKDKLYRLWIGKKALLFLIAPETIEVLLISNTSLEKGDFYKFLLPWLGQGLVTSDGDKWRRHRKLLTPTFHFRILDDFLIVMNEQAAIFVQKLDEASKRKDFLDIFHFASLCTLDIICETAMGCSIGAQRGESLYGKAIITAAHSVMSRGPRPWVHKDCLYYLTQEGKQFKEAVDTLHDFTYQVIADRIRAKDDSVQLENPELEEEDVGTRVKKRLALLDMLLESDFTREEIREEVDTFMFAGHDTTSSALSWLVYILGLHPEVQDGVVQEIDEVFAGNKERHVTQDDMKQLKYLDCVIKESQRLFPPVPGVTRKLAEDTEIGESVGFVYVITVMVLKSRLKEILDKNLGRYLRTTICFIYLLKGGFLIPKGTECSAAIYSLHRNPEIYPNPEVFDPDRFLPQNSAGRHPFAFIPFSAGPRNCIGQRFAQMELRVLVCHVLRHFRLRSLDPRDRVILVPEVVLRADKPLRIQMIPV